jgi:predicted nucleic acid-binding protein
VNYLLDTNVMTAFVRRHEGFGAVMRSLDNRDAVHTSAVVVGELLHGLEQMPEGRRRRLLGEDIERTLLSMASIVPVDSGVARAYAGLRARATARGRPIGTDNDFWIAATAIHRGMTLVSADAGFARAPELRTTNWLLPR